jgi:hypothetical protein
VLIFQDSNSETLLPKFWSPNKIKAIIYCIIDLENSCTHGVYADLTEQYLSELSNSVNIMTILWIRRPRFDFQQDGEVFLCHGVWSDCEAVLSGI